MNKEIRIPSRIENISMIENLIDEVSIELGLVADLYGNVLIAVIEAVTNAIVHGNKLQEDKFVSIWLKSENTNLEVKIQDEGNGFEFDNVPDPTKPDNVEKPDGRGVFLMKHLADGISFDKGGSIVVLKFSI
ncbi:MAG: ATP-binding protein [Salinivirgaceae bacterium]|nr:ATP-binding protein [Salinivirgaceae bacterium]